MIRDYLGVWPEIHEQAFVAETADVIGRVTLEKNSSVWYGAVLRGDVAGITIGENTSVQDNCVLHCDHGSDMVIGRNVTVGHGAIVHGATVGDNTLIGMGAIVLDGAKIGESCVIAAGALVKERAEIPDGSMVVGVPGKIIRSLSEEQIRQSREQSYYVELSGHYKK